jgi:hypothetical protein
MLNNAIDAMAAVLTAKFVHGAKGEESLAVFDAMRRDHLEHDQSPR